MKFLKTSLILIGFVVSTQLLAAPYAICCYSKHVHDGLTSFWIGMDAAPPKHTTVICKERSYDQDAYGAGNCRTGDDSLAPFGVCCKKLFGKSFWIGFQTPPSSNQKELCKQHNAYEINATDCYTSH